MMVKKWSNLGFRQMYGIDALHETKVQQLKIDLFVMKSKPLSVNVAYPIKELTSGSYFNLEFRGLGIRKAAVWGS